jgi:hypothetical protein
MLRNSDTDIQLQGLHHTALRKVTVKVADIPKAMVT